MWSCWNHFKIISYWFLEMVISFMTYEGQLLLISLEFYLEVLAISPHWIYISTVPNFRKFSSIMQNSSLSYDIMLVLVNAPIISFLFGFIVHGPWGLLIFHWVLRIIHCSLMVIDTFLGFSAQTMLRHDFLLTMSAGLNMKCPLQRLMLSSGETPEPG